jgi:hypothetical protein
MRQRARLQPDPLTTTGNIGTSNIAGKRILPYIRHAAFEGMADFMLEILDTTLVYRRLGRIIALDSLDYASKFERLVRYGFRKAFAAILAERPIETDELLELAVEFGLIER